MLNERGAGRKRTLSDNDIQVIRDRIQSGEKIKDIALDYHISRQTLSKWLNFEVNCLYRMDGFNSNTDRFVCRSLAYWNKINTDITKSNDAFRLRLDYMHKDSLCTAILANPITKSISIKNYTDILFQRAFGAKQNPNWTDFLYFLEERCFPKNRYNCTEILDFLNLDSFDPLDIVLTTAGRLEGDHHWIRFIHLEA